MLYDQSLVITASNTKHYVFQAMSEVNAKGSKGLGLGFYSELLKYPPKPQEPEKISEDSVDEKAVHSDEGLS